MKYIFQNILDAIKGFCCSNNTTTTKDEVRLDKNDGDFSPIDMDAEASNIVYEEEAAINTIKINMPLRQKQNNRSESNGSKSYEIEEDKKETKKINNMKKTLKTLRQFCNINDGDKFRKELEEGKPKLYGIFNKVLKKEAIYLKKNENTPNTRDIRYPDHEQEKNINGRN